MNNKPDDTGKWYDKFTDKKTEKTGRGKKRNRKETGREIPSSDKNTIAQQKKSNNPTGRRPEITICRPVSKKIPIISQKPLFADNLIPKDAVNILANFDTVIRDITPMSSKQLAKLPFEIRGLSHELTDERLERRMGYMNETARLAAYTRYFMWWNLVRLVRLFANHHEQDFALEDGGACLDIGSGPLTVPIALWLARPELRTKKITWYCLDISSAALALGEELYLSVAAKTLGENTDNRSPWRIIRVKGEPGTEIRQKVSFITCANMFNELFQHAAMPPDYLAKKYTETLTAYMSKERCSVFINEPGVPRFARLLSLLRDAFLRGGFTPISPCPHEGTCPMNGKSGGKWCNFAFVTGNAPSRLLKLSAAAGIPKERAVLSFIFMTKNTTSKTNDNELLLRIASDPIRLPGNRTGFYACSKLGLALVITGTALASGDLITIRQPEHPELLRKDAKSGAVELEI